MKPLNEQINPKYIKQVQMLDQYAHLIHICLPVEYHSHVQVANVRNGELVLVTDSPVWSTRLRQLSPQILSTVNEHSSKFDSIQRIYHIQIKTRYHPNPKLTGKRSKDRSTQKPEITDATTRLLAQSADSMTNNELKKSLLRLSETLTKKRQD